MAFRDHLQDAVSYALVNPINDMRLAIERNHDSTILFENVKGSIGHKAAANVCLRENMAKHWTNNI